MTDVTLKDQLQVIRLYVKTLLLFIIRLIAENGKIPNMAKNI